MKEMFKARTIIAFWMYGVFGWMCIKGLVKAEALIVVVSALMTFYYAEKIHNGKSGGGNNGH